MLKKLIVSYLNIPDVLTTIRLLLIPLVFVSIPKDPYLTLAILFVAFITDILDGYLARKYGLHERIFGKIYDHLVDKLMILTILYALNVYMELPNWAYVFFLFREFLLIIGGAFLWFNNVRNVEGSNILGKVAGVSFYTMVVLYIFRMEYKEFFLYVSVVLSLFAFISYSIRELRKLGNKPLNL